MRLAFADTALAIVERIESRGQPTMTEWGPRSGTDGPAQYQVRHLERFRRTPYPEIVTRMNTLLGRPLPDGSALREHTSLVVDATGVGRPVVDLLEQAGRGPVAVTITGGDAVTRDVDGGYRVPKRNLVSTLQVLLQSSRLRVAEKLPHAAILAQEMLDFRGREASKRLETHP